MDLSSLSLPQSLVGPISGSSGFSTSGVSQSASVPSANLGTGSNPNLSSSSSTSGSSTSSVGSGVSASLQNLGPGPRSPGLSIGSPLSLSASAWSSPLWNISNLATQSWTSSVSQIYDFGRDIISSSERAVAAFLVDLFSRRGDVLTNNPANFSPLPVSDFQNLDLRAYLPAVIDQNAATSSFSLQSFLETARSFVSPTPILAAGDSVSIADKSSLPLSNIAGMFPNTGVWSPRSLEQLASSRVRTAYDTGDVRHYQWEQRSQPNKRGSRTGTFESLFKFSRGLIQKVVAAWKTLKE